MDLMSQAEYGRHRGVTRQAINKALNAKKFFLKEDPRTGKKGIDPVEADRALGLNVQRVLAGDEESAASIGREQERSTPGLTQARTATEVYRARLAELEYNERLGKLRPIEQMEMAAQQCGEVVLRTFEGIVGRAEELHARSNKEGVAGVRSGLRDIVRDLRRVAAREFSKMAEGSVVDDEVGLD